MREGGGDSCAERGEGGGEGPTHAHLLEDSNGVGLRGGKGCRGEGEAVSTFVRLACRWPAAGVPCLVNLGMIGQVPEP